MATDELSRHNLFGRLRAVLGESEATTLIEYLPPVGWADVATKHDLESLRHALMAALHSEIKKAVFWMMGFNLALIGMIIGSLKAFG